MGSDLRVSQYPESLVGISLQTFVFGYESADHLLDVFRTCYGPVSRVVAALDAEQAAALEADILDLLEKANGGRSGSLVIPGAYLEVVIERS